MEQLFLSSQIRHILVWLRLWERIANIDSTVQGHRNNNSGRAFRLDISFTFNITTNVRSGLDKKQPCKIQKYRINDTKSLSVKMLLKSIDSINKMQKDVISPVSNWEVKSENILFCHFLFKRLLCGWRERKDTETKRALLSNYAIMTDLSMNKLARQKQIILF